MIEIQIDYEIIQVKPEITIGQYQKIYKNTELYENDPTQFLSLLLNVPMTKLKDLPYKQVKFIHDYLTQQILNQNPKDETHFMFTHNGVTYGLESDWSKLTWGGWVDLEVYSSKDIDEHIHRIMAILYRPVESTDKNNKYKLKPYKSQEIEERAELFKELPFSYWLGVSVFFLLTAQILTNNIHSSLNMTQKINLMVMRGWKILPKWIKRKLPLDSILRLPTNSQMRISQSLNK
jgi:hypothetical protein